MYTVHDIQPLLKDQIIAGRRDGHPLRQVTL